MKTIVDIITEYDIQLKKGILEYEICNAFQSIQEEDIGSKYILYNEILAFSFAENYQDLDTGWGTYFGPQMYLNNGDGTAREYPSIQLITPEIIDYWKHRALESKNPIFVARYCGLVWDFEKKITKKNPSIDIAILYIKSIIDIANENYYDTQYETFLKLDRALDLIIKLNQTNLVDSIKYAIINFECNHSDDSKAGDWGYAFDFLIFNKNIKLTSEEEYKIIQNLEHKLEHLWKIDQWATKRAGERLATYYNKKSKPIEVKRVVLKVGEAFHLKINDVSAMQAASWLEKLHAFYVQFQLNDEATEILKEIRALGSKVAKDLATISQKTELPLEKINAFIDLILQSNIEEIFYTLITNFLPKKEENRSRVFELTKTAPIMSIFSQKILDKKGRVVATIGSTGSDIEGRTLLQISQSLSINSIFLHLFLDKAINNSILSKENCLDFIKMSSVINKDRLKIIEHGLNAYFNKDFIAAIHILIPQVEEAIRNTLEFVGGVVLKATTRNTFQLRTFDDILRDPILVGTLTEDVTTYLQVLYTDPRGWNLRNNVCHGIADYNQFNQQTADRVFHSILCLGYIRKQ